MSLVERALEKALKAGAGNATKSVPQPIAAIEVTAKLNAAQLQEEYSATNRRVLVNRDALRDEGYLPETESDRLFADYYRQIKRPLIAQALETSSSVPGALRLIMVTSALPGDGKTFTSINLAFSVARERDVSVLLVDGDVRKPHVSRIFGVGDEPGLLDAVSDSQTEIEQLVLPTDVRGLSILPAGKQRENATELFASARMSAVVAQLLERSHRRIVLFDTPPVLASSESRALINLAGQVVLVVRSGHTLRQAVLDAMGHIGEGRSLSLVLNQCRISLANSYYGYRNYGDDQKST